MRHSNISLTFYYMIRILDNVSRLLYQKIKKENININNILIFAYQLLYTVFKKNRIKRIEIQCARVLTLSIF